MAELFYRDRLDNCSGRWTKEGNAFFLDNIPVQQPVLPRDYSMKRLAGADYRHRRGAGFECSQALQGEILHFDPVVPLIIFTGNIIVHLFQRGKLSFVNIGRDVSQQIYIAALIEVSPDEGAVFFFNDTAATE